MDMAKYSVVCGNTDASPEVVTDGDDGYTVDPDAPAAIADAIAKLLDDAALARRFAERGFRKVELIYSDSCFRENLNHLIAAIRE